MEEKHIPVVTGTCFILRLTETHENETLIDLQTNYIFIRWASMHMYGCVYAFMIVCLPLICM